MKVKYVELGELKQMGDSVRDAITGTGYTSMRGAQLYPTGGSTDDWFTNKKNMYGFTIELRDTGSYGFVLPKSQIIPTGKDALAAVLKFIEILEAKEQ